MDAQNRLSELGAEFWVCFFMRTSLANRIAGSTKNQRMPGDLNHPLPTTDLKSRTGNTLIRPVTTVNVKSMGDGGDEIQQGGDAASDPIPRDVMEPLIRRVAARIARGEQAVVRRLPADKASFPKLLCLDQNQWIYLSQAHANLNGQTESR